MPPLAAQSLLLGALVTAVPTPAHAADASEFLGFADKTQFLIAAVFMLVILVRSVVTIDTQSRKIWDQVKEAKLRNDWQSAASINLFLFYCFQSFSNSRDYPGYFLLSALWTWILTDGVSTAKNLVTRPPQASSHKRDARILYRDFPVHGDNFSKVKFLIKCAEALREIREENTRLKHMSKLEANLATIQDSQAKLAVVLEVINGLHHENPEIRRESADFVQNFLNDPATRIALLTNGRINEMNAAIRRIADDTNNTDAVREDARNLLPALSAIGERGAAAAPNQRTPEDLPPSKDRPPPSRSRQGIG